MSWGDDPELQSRVLLLSKLVQQLEVGVLWDVNDRRDARILTEWISRYCRLRNRPAAVPPADIEEHATERN